MVRLASIRGLLRPAAYLLCSAACAACGLWTANASVAAYLASQSEWDLALRITPEDSSLWRRSGLATIAADAARSRSALQQALRLNERDHEARLGLGFLYERQGNTDAAEQMYTAAAMSSQRFQPRYALAAFYWRTQRPHLFWPAAARAAAVRSASLDRIFDLAHRLEPDKTLDSKLDLHTAESLGAYARYLLAHRKDRQLVAVVPRLTDDDPQLLLELSTYLVAIGASGTAVDAWNKSGAPHLDPAAGSSIHDPHFRASLGRAFDWTPKRSEGVHTIFTPGGLTVTLTGDQSASSSLVELAIPIVPARRYRFTSTHEVNSDSAEAAGLAWEVVGARKLLEPSGHTTITFETGSRQSLGRLVLRYDRPPGHVRWVGSIHLSSAALELLPK